MKNALLIDPKDKTVTLVELPDGHDELLAGVRVAIGAPQLAIVAVPENHIAVWVDAMGILKKDRAFWHFNDSDYRFAGRCVITAIDRLGVPHGFPDEIDTDEVKAALIFDPPEVLDRIHEVLVMAPDGSGAMVPMIHRQVIWTDREPGPVPTVVVPEIADEEPEPEISGWSIFETDDGYRAFEMVLRGHRLVPTNAIEAANLDEIRKMLPLGLVRIEPSETDPSDLVESWSVPTH